MLKTLSSFSGVNLASASSHSRPYVLGPHGGNAGIALPCAASAPNRFGVYTYKQRGVYAHARL
jgi:hypothetical protein